MCTEYECEEEKAGQTEPGGPCHVAAAAAGGAAEELTHDTDCSAAGDY